MVYRRTARSEKIRAESEHRILSAARKLFAKRGYDATTMQDIVREAKTSIGNVYFYFANKEDLLRALLESAARDNWARADSVITRIGPGYTRIAAVLYTNLWSFTGPTRDLAKIAVAGVPKVVHYIVEIHALRMRELLKENLQDRSDLELQLMAGAVLGANRMLVESFVMGDIDIELHPMADFLVRWHLRAMRVPEKQITQAMETAVGLLPDAGATANARTSHQREKRD